MNISLTPTLEKFVQDKVASGLYNSVSEVIREALRLLASKDSISQERIVQLNRDIEDGWNPITNEQLLHMRAYSPNLAFAKGDYMMQVVNNGIGLDKIGAYIKQMAGSIGSSEETIEGLSKVESGKVKAGIQLLAGTDGTPDGIYQVTTTNKNSKEQIQAAFNYLKNILPNNYRKISLMT